MKLPSDRQILECIFDRYKGEFAKFDVQKGRGSKVYVPIDCRLIAKTLNTEHDLVFGRLYYHLEKKYGYERPDGVKVHFFALKAGKDFRCVNFPLLASVLAGLKEEQGRHMLTQAIAGAALAVSLGSMVVSLWTK